LLDRLDAAGIERLAITLHVGPGTFLPVRSGDLRSHRVEAERYEVTPAVAARLDAARREGRPIVAVGTTTTRVLEHLGQRAAGGPLPSGRGETALTILPGHRFTVVDKLMTNFHLPKSSLLVLVAALAGRERILAAYRHAVAQGYRFYSYGDASLIV
jgi:S-adenosylmethionine:tRNA ribosyltransferase-isomerase